MSADIDISVVKDTVTPAIEQLKATLTPSQIKRAVGTACTRQVQDHLKQLPSNKRGFPSTQFWQGAARGTDWDETPDGVKISVDNEEKPGAVRLQFHGGTVKAGKNPSCKGGGATKFLTIPNMAGFYGHSACEFTNLRFVMFRPDLAALVVAEGGAGRVSFASGREKRVAGAGVRARGLVAYWLKPEVDIPAYPDLIPSEDALAQTAIGAVVDLVQEKGGLK